MKALSAATAVFVAGLLVFIEGARAGEQRPEVRRITMEEVAQHDSITDCWMAIDGKVYDFTRYIPDHPAPAVVFDQWCGKEATEAYRTKGYGDSHGPEADAMLPEYRVGELERDR